MKRIVLESIDIVNFRGVKHLTVNFNEKETFIYGQNATYKSTIFNAFLWLWSGKDSLDRENFEIKRLVNGSPIDKVEVDVSASLLVDGSPLHLRRKFVEKWKKPKANAVEVFDGNRTVAFINDAPVSITEYQEFLKDIIDETVFKMVTNPMYFANMDWQVQREYLFKMGKCMTDDQIADTKKEFRDLLDMVDGKTMAKFKEEISAKRKIANDELGKIQPRIDQVIKGMPASIDFDAIEKEIVIKQGELEDIERSITSKHELENQRYEGIREKQREANRLKIDQKQLVYDAESAERDRVRTENDKVNKVKDKYRDITNQISTKKDLIRRLESNIHGDRSTHESKKHQLENLRSEWHTENAKQYDGEVDCHNCGQKLPDHLITKAKDLFNESKLRKLDEINIKGGRIGDECESILKGIEEKEALLVEENEKLQALQKEWEALSNEVDQAPIIQPKKIIPESIEGYSQFAEKIASLEAEINEYKPVEVDDSELKEKKTSITNEIDNLKKRLWDKSEIEKDTAEIERLKKKGEELSQLVADYEKIELTMKSFTKFKIEESDNRINSLFTFVTFKLFDYTIGGDEKETCVPLVNGVPFKTANTAGQLNAGIDIINALSRYFNVSAPIFLDNRESINEIIHTDSQVINLVVSNDKQLVIK